MTSEITPERIAELRTLDAELPRVPWYQLSGKYMAVDHGDESPQVFHAFWDNDKLCELRNALPDLLDEIERLRAIEKQVARYIYARDYAAQEAGGVFRELRKMLEEKP